MNLYEIERIDRDGRPIDTQQVTADMFALDTGNGALWFHIHSENGERLAESKTVALFAPGTWGQVLLLDETAVQAKTNTITHPAATADEVAAMLEGATLTTTSGGDAWVQWHPITGTAVYDPALAKVLQETYGKLPGVHGRH